MKYYIKYFIVGFTFLSYSQSGISEYNPCKPKLPIDTEEKAWCAAQKVLHASSCLSGRGFKRTTKELDSVWLLVSEDKNPNKSMGCGKTEIKVEKSSGKILYE